MKIAPNKVVAVTYRLHVDDGENGKSFYEEAKADYPFYFLFGAENTLPALEAALLGKSVGDTFDVFIDFEHAYGDYDDSKRVILPKSRFKEAEKQNRNLLKIGNVIPMQDDEGNHLRGEILKVDYTGVHMDFNSPLAGLDLYFEGEIVEIREATPEEIDHKHVHGPGGHHH
jgi:FKBP-type peptidyl-prolyl cis-trans isomerase SlyD